jgi:hypothetical protein
MAGRPIPTLGVMLEMRIYSITISTPSREDTAATSKILEGKVKVVNTGRWTGISGIIVLGWSQRSRLANIVYLAIVGIDPNVVPRWKGLRHVNSQRSREVRVCSDCETTL